MTRDFRERRHYEVRRNRVRRSSQNSTSQQLVMLPSGRVNGCSLKNAILVPSGDQAGLHSLRSSVFVRAYLPLPERVIT